MPDPPDLTRELSRMEAEPLLDVERRLVVGSLVLGVFLLVVLGWLAHWMGRGA